MAMSFHRDSPQVYLELPRLGWVKIPMVDDRSWIEFSTDVIESDAFGQSFPGKRSARFDIKFWSEDSDHHSGLISGLQDCIGMPYHHIDGSGAGIGIAMTLGPHAIRARVHIASLQYHIERYGQVRVDIEMVSAGRVDTVDMSGLRNRLGKQRGSRYAA